MRQKNYYPPEQLDWLRTYRSRYHYNELAPAFNRTFGTNYSTPKIYGICDAYGIRTDKARQTPARTIPPEWKTWLKHEAARFNDYTAFRKAFNARFGTNYKSRTAFKRLCERANVKISKHELFPQFAEDHFNEIKAFCDANWSSMTRTEFTSAFNQYFHTDYGSAVYAWIISNSARLGISAKRSPRYQFEPTPEELDVFRTRYKSMTAKDFAELCNQTVNTHYNPQQVAHRAVWLVNHGYLRDDEIRKHKKNAKKEK